MKANRENKGVVAVEVPRYSGMARIEIVWAKLECLLGPKFLNDDVIEGMMRLLQVRAQHEGSIVWLGVQ